MTEQGESGFEKDAPELLNNLEGRTKALQDYDYLATVVDKGIAEAESLLHAGKTADAEQKYLQTKALVDRAEASIKAEPLAWRLLWIEMSYLLVLLSTGYVAHQWPHYWLWKEFLTLHAGAAWFGALGGVSIGLYGIYGHVQARDFDPKYQLWYICRSSGQSSDGLFA